MSDFLFALPSFFEGIARNIDIFGTLQDYNSSSNPMEADARALRKDWEAVGRDIRFAMKTHQKSQKENG